MKSWRYGPAIALLAATGLMGCRGGNPENGEAVAVETPAEPPAPAPPPPPTDHRGTVVETMSTAEYTYLRVDTGEKKVWLAAPKMALEVGQQIEAPPGMEMRNFRSPTLGRIFEQIYFVGMVRKPAAATPPAAVAPPPDAPAGPAMDFSGLARAEGGKTVAEVWSGSAQLAGQKVAVRGKVVKFVPDVMGKNWLHVQDGTGADGTNDLTVTSRAKVKVGDTVLVRGAVVVNKDFGFGYKYDVLIEDAEVIVEK